MSTLNEQKYAALAAITGLSQGSVSELEVAWLRAETGSDGSVSELWQTYLDINQIQKGQLNERQYRWLRRRGYTGNLPEMFYAYWGDLAAAGSDFVAVNSIYVVDSFIAQVFTNKIATGADNLGWSMTVDAVPIIAVAVVPEGDTLTITTDTEMSAGAVVEVTYNGIGNTVSGAQNLTPFTQTCSERVLP